MDRTLSAQLGKPSSMRGETSIRRYLALLPSTMAPATESTRDWYGNEEDRLQDIAVASWTVS
jgi:hypothetical protein